MNKANDMLIKTINLKKYYPIVKPLLKKVIGYVKAVDNVSLEIVKGESLGLVGESGCGKTTLGMVLAKLLEPTSGKIIFKNMDITRKLPKRIRSKIRMVFQDPYASLNPRIKILDQVIEPLIANKLVDTKKEALEKAFKILENVGIDVELAEKYPHELSGGQRQRIVIARALISDPEFLILDEPTSMLDVSVQAQILNLLKKLKNKYFLTYLFITHNLAVARYISDRIAVMYLGEIVELGKVREIFENPMHPYTKALISAYPSPDPEKPWNPIEIGENIADPANPPSGCRFHPRCPYAKDLCKSKKPSLMKIEDNRFIRCFLALR